MSCCLTKLLEVTEELIKLQSSSWEVQMCDLVVNVINCCCFFFFFLKFGHVKQSKCVSCQEALTCVKMPRLGLWA